MGLMLIFFLILGCAGPKPVLYPNDHFQEVGQSQADQDIAECTTLAEEYVESHKTEQIAGGTIVGAGTGAATGAIGGAIRGSAGTGAAVGAATGATVGLLHGLFASAKPSRAHMNFVNKCLSKRGYEPTGWN
ncbi:MAG: hypothetical protein GKS05_06835 [Nitrospirales bacterium]|nr:hypothetical protein [Nitrospirales bacterium]